MTKLLISACYVGSNFVAALIVISLIVRNVPVADRVDFFVFQSLFYPLVSIASQAKMFVNYNRVASGHTIWILDFVICSLLFVVLHYLIGDSLEPASLAMLSLSVLFSYKAAAEVAKIQFNKSGLEFVAVPLFTMLARILVCYLLITGGAGYVYAFFCSTLAFYLIPTAFSYFNAASNKPVLESNSAVQQNGLYFLFFVSVAFFFQWDRILTSMLDLPKLVESSGVYIILVLSPVSLLFATVYRANARSIFAVESTFNWANYLASAMPFVGLTVIYVSLLVMFWQPVNQLLFPFFEGGYPIMLLLSLAVVVDRLGLLLLYMSQRPVFYISLIVVRLILISLAFTFFISRSDWLSIDNIYSVYAAMALCGFLVSLGLVFFLTKPEHE